MVCWIYARADLKTLAYRIFASDEPATLRSVVVGAAGKILLMIFFLRCSDLRHNHDPTIPRICSIMKRERKKLAEKPQIFTQNREKKRNYLM